MKMTTARRGLVALAALTTLASACGSSSSSSSSAASSSAPTVTSVGDGPTTAASAAPSTAGPTTSATANFDAKARCEANKKAGKITYLSSFDFAAAASIIDVVVADAKGYFKDLCLDVELKPSFSTANYKLVAANQAQFSAAGSYTEIINNSTDGAKFTAFVDYGKTPIEGLVAKDPATASVAALKGKTIGVKGDIPPSIVALLASAGLKRGTDYKEVLLDGFDPKAHLQQAIDALPVFKSNEPGQLDAGGITYKLFDPTSEKIPGSFGILYTSADYAAKNPTVVQDFARAALKGWEDAAADPTAAVKASLDRINAAGNQNFLTEAGETFRWKAELAEAQKGAAGKPVGLIDAAVFDAEVKAYTDAGILKAADPKAYDAKIAADLYDAAGKVKFAKLAS